MGVYVVKVEVLDGLFKGDYGGVVFIGVWFMFGQDNMFNIEIFLFDFKGDFYGVEFLVGLVDYLCLELKFDGLEVLII